MKDKVVVFTSNNARVLINPPEGAGYWRHRDDALVNPDLDKVRGFAPLYWKKDGDKVVVMSAEERAARNRSIEEFGVDNKISEHSPQLKAALKKAMPPVSELSDKERIFLLLEEHRLSLDVLSQTNAQQEKENESLHSVDRELMKEVISIREMHKKLQVQLVIMTLAVAVLAIAGIVIN